MKTDNASAIGCVDSTPNQPPMDQDGNMPEYLSNAAVDISRAMKMEAEEDYTGCIDHYR